MIASVSVFKLQVCLFKTQLLVLVDVEKLSENAIHFVPLQK